MSQHDFKNWMRHIQWVDPDAHASGIDLEDVDTPIDTKGWRYAVVVVSVGDSAGTLAVQVTASDATAGTYTAVTGALLSVGLTSDNTRLIGVIDLQGDAANLDRFLQLSGVSATGIIDFGVDIILLNPITSTELIDYSSGGADELDFDV